MFLKSASWKYEFYLYITFSLVAYHVDLLHSSVPVDGNKGNLLFGTKLAFLRALSKYPTNPVLKQYETINRVISDNQLKANLLYRKKLLQLSKYQNLGGSPFANNWNKRFDNRNYVLPNLVRTKPFARYLSARPYFNYRNPIINFHNYGLSGKQRNQFHQPFVTDFHTQEFEGRTNPIFQNASIRNIDNNVPVTLMGFPSSESISRAASIVTNSYTNGKGISNHRPNIYQSFFQHPYEQSLALMDQTDHNQMRVDDKHFEQNYEQYLFSPSISPSAAHPSLAPASDYNPVGFQLFQSPGSDSEKQLYLQPYGPVNPAAQKLLQELAEPVPQKLLNQFRTPTEATQLHTDYDQNNNFDFQNHQTENSQKPTSNTQVERVSTEPHYNEQTSQSEQQTTPSNHQENQPSLNYHGNTNYDYNQQPHNTHPYPSHDMVQSFNTEPQYHAQQPPQTFQSNTQTDQLQHVYHDYDVNNLPHVENPPSQPVPQEPQYYAHQFSRPESSQTFPVEPPQTNLISKPARTRYGTYADLVIDKYKFDQPVTHVIKTIDNFQPRRHIPGKTLRVLCIGDSLTTGYYGDRKSYHPFSIMLSKLLNENLGLPFEVINHGFGGDKVHGQMYTKLIQLIHDEQPDLVVILGGLNDLIKLDVNNDIFEDIAALHELCHKNGIPTVSLTIPETQIPLTRQIYANYNQFLIVWGGLNDKIRHWSSRWVVTCDLAKEFPLASLPEANRRLMWSADDIHPTIAGYDEIGRIIFNCIINEHYVLDYLKSTSKRSKTDSSQITERLSAYMRIMNRNV